VSEIQKTMDGLFVACAQCDFSRMSEFIDESVDWMIYAPVTVFPYAGPRRGREAAVQALREIMDEYALEGYDREIVMRQGDQVAVMGVVRVRQRATGRCLRYRGADFMRFKDGRLISLRHFVNSFDLAEQALGRDLAV